MGACSRSLVFAWFGPQLRPGHFSFGRQPNVATGAVPLKDFPLLAACEFSGALGLVLGIWWLILGVAAAIGLILYFVL